MDSAIADPDHALMARIASGDARAYRELLSKHLHRSVKFAHRMLGDRQEAEDVAQEVCLKIWHEAPRWKPQAKFSTWLYRVLVNACMDRKRKVVFLSAEGMDREDPEPGAEAKLIERQRAEKVRKALEELPDRQRAAVTLSYYEELSNQEAADAMGLALGAFQQLLFRAKRSLKDALAEQEDERRMG